MAMKLHLGCGQKRLDGYVNIDFPASEHTVQTERVADLYADLTGLRYPLGSLSEVRLHHVFEHFPRPRAMALAAAWASWLEPGGLLWIEVPDFERAARRSLAWWRSRRERRTALRHLHGSHEASWAVHWEGWTPSSLRQLLGGSGFGRVEVERTSWGPLDNLTVKAIRNGAPANRSVCESAVATLLEDYLVDASAIERRLHGVWMDAWREQADRSWGSEG
jgi:hypothetical protein